MSIPKKVRDAVDERDGGQCQRCGLLLFGVNRSRHHRRPKGMGGSKLLDRPAVIVTLCGSATDYWGCHYRTESQRSEAFRLGWLIPHGVRPEEWPVYRFGRSWEQPGELWTPADPHPRQIEMGAAA